MAPSVPPIGPARYHYLLLALATAVLAAGCAAGDGAGEALTASTLLDDRAAGVIAASERDEVATTTSTPSPAARVGDDEPGPEDSSSATPAPAWIGQRTLPTGPDGEVVPQTTPEELRDRRFVTVDVIEPPAAARFEGSVGSVDPAVLQRSTWVSGCPVEPEDLSYLTLSFWGFDGEVHSGEMIVNHEVAGDILWVFERLFAARFPIEEMRVVSQQDLDAPPTGDGNNTTAFVCRPVTGGTNFSQHAYGLAVDINPFHNPYRRDDLVLPELAGHYLDRAIGRPGMVTEGDPVVDAFAAIGWSWGGDWRSLVDYQHFSRNGR